MSTLFGARDGGSHPATDNADAVIDHDGRACRYLTDGVTLYRSLGAIVHGPCRMVGLEGCRSLDVILIPSEELRRRGLRTVTPAAAVADRPS